ncbi:MAG TPA: dodecin family protein [Candidatus Thermoplasmatota archaeon]|nr:dodecin family protein [Candidatus Thermoplasmatota archaeon]
MPSAQTLRNSDRPAHDHRTAKVVELVSSSSRGFQDAIENALEDARQTTRGITGAHVEAMSVQCEDGQIVSYKVNLKLVFGVERSQARDVAGERDGARSKGRNGSR